MKGLAALIMMASSWAGTLVAAIAIGFLFSTPWYGVFIFACVWHWGGYFLSVALAAMSEQ